MAVDPQTAAIIASVAIEVGKLLGGLFHNKNYPYSRVDIRVVNGVAVPFAVVVLDSSGQVEWDALANELAAKTNAELSRVGFAGVRGVRSGDVNIGYATARKGSQLGTGYFVSLNRGGFESGAEHTGISTFETAIELWLEMMSDNIIGLPEDVCIFCDEASIHSGDGTLNDSFVTALDANSNALAQTLIALTGSFATTLNTATANTSAFSASLETNLLSGLAAILRGSDGILNDAINIILGASQSATQAARGLNTTHQNTISELAQMAILRAAGLNTQFQTNVIEQTDTLIAATSVMQRALFDTILAGIEAMRQNAINNTDSTLNRIVKAVHDAVTQGDGLLADLAGVLERIGVGIDRGVKTILSGIGKGAQNVLEEINDNILRSVIVGIKEVFALDLDETNALERWLFDVSQGFDLDIETCRERFQRPADPENFWDNVIYLMANIASSVLFPLAIAQAKATGCLQQWSKGHPTLVMEPGDSALAYFRALITKECAAENISAQGFKTEDAEKMLETARPIPEPGILITFWLRGFINDEEFTRSMLGHGFEPKYLVAYKEAAFFIPPVQDLITMAVREVFNKSISVPFGQFEDFPEEFGTWAAKQGVSREWAENYWAAHWSLPSIQMGFEMLHRRVINEAELKQLMQALDIMPGWRDRLIQISYNPFTRVDIRRMNRVGVLSSEDVYEAYLDIGYNEVNARKLQEFVELLNAKDEGFGADLADDLTRSNIIGFYNDGIIDRAAALGLLMNEGLSVLVAELFLSDADFKLERTERKAEINQILNEAKIGLISTQEASDRFNQLDLAAGERDKAILSLQRVNQANMKMPSKADLDKFVQNDLLSQAEYESNMSRLGYSQFWIEKYWTLNNEG